MVIYPLWSNIPILNTWLDSAYQTTLFYFLLKSHLVLFSIFRSFMASSLGRSGTGFNYDYLEYCTQNLKLIYTTRSNYERTSISIFFNQLEFNFGHFGPWMVNLKNIKNQNYRYPITWIRCSILKTPKSSKL